MRQIDLAREYLGKKEKPKNSGFEDPEFEADMIKFGEWQKGYPWCACFAQMIFRKAYPEKNDVLRKLFSPSTRDTINNFKAAGYKIYAKPSVGALVIWASYVGGKMQSTGHAGIVTEVINENNFKSIEGNTSGAGSRNGDRVAENPRNLSVKSTGLNVMGFIEI